MVTRLKLPIGIQSFEKIRQGSYVYVDKTRFIAQLANGGDYYFLSRPRRFGKSLLVDTLDCAFSGRRELFKGLYIAGEDAWNWNRKHQVIRIDWSAVSIRKPEDLKERIAEIVETFARKLSIQLASTSLGGRFLELVQTIAEKSGEKVVILVDEYDKPILDNLEIPHIALQMRDILKDFYGSFKTLHLFLRFVFLTGVSKFAKTGIFSGLNNLKDITVDERYSALCGYTQQDLDATFSPWPQNLDKDKVRLWYNGYAWTGEAVYNPFDILLLMDTGKFKSYWFETGTPTFLAKLLAEKPRSMPDLEGLQASEELLGSFEIENIRLETLLFQAGYLTIKKTDHFGAYTIHTLGFPNIEVKSSYALLILELYTQDDDSNRTLTRLNTAFEAGDVTGLRNIVHAFFASIPHDWYRKNQLSNFEGYYASVVYAYFASLGYEIVPEDTTNRGRIDLTVKTSSGIWLFEFKVEGVDRSGNKSPLEQLRERKYADKYRTDGRPIRQIGIAFNAQTRNIDAWETEQ